MWLKTSCVLSADFWILSHLVKIITRIQVLILIYTLYMVLGTLYNYPYFVLGTWYLVPCTIHSRTISSRLPRTCLQLSTVVSGTSLQFFERIGCRISSTTAHSSSQSSPLHHQPCGSIC